MESAFIERPHLLRLRAPHGPRVLTVAHVVLLLYLDRIAWGDSDMWGVQRPAGAWLQLHLFPHHHGETGLPGSAAACVQDRLQDPRQRHSESHDSCAIPDPKGPGEGCMF